MGLTIVMWNKDSVDTNPAQNVVQTATPWATAVRNGSISLQHDLFNFTAPAIAPVIDIVRNAGFKTQRIDTCLGKSDAYVDTSLFALANNGKPIPASAAVPNSANPTIVSSFGAILSIAVLMLV